MKPEHREAVRTSKVVRRYLEAAARSGRRQSPDRLRERIAKATEKKAGSTNVLDQLKPTQQIKELEEQLVQAEDSSTFDELEGELIGVAGSYADREGISRSVWREFGVSAAVRNKAGIK